MSLPYFMCRTFELEAKNSRLESEIKRLTSELSNICGASRNLESDLSRAKVEISFLKSEVDRLLLLARSNQIEAAATRLDYGGAKSKIERLSQAGDALDDALQAYFEASPLLLTEPLGRAFMKGRAASNQWHKTKEGIKS